MAVLAGAADGYGRPTGFSVTQDEDPVHYNTLAYDGTLGHQSEVTSGSGVTALSYYPGSSILRQAVTTANSSVVRSETRVVDLAGRITGVHTSAGGTTPVTLATVGYTVDALGRRTVARRDDGSTWNYGYNDRSEVTSGSKKLPNAALAAGQQFAYAYDGIGNRTSASTDPQGTYPRQTSYTANDLNQYASITYPRSLDVLVRTPATNLTVSSGTNDVGIDHQSTYHRAEITVTGQDAANAQWLPVEVTAGGGTLSEGHLWLPPANLSPTHDDDGNLTNDGRWDYVWDGENRLVSMRPTTAAVTAGAPNIGLDSRYDHRSRRIAKKVIDLGNNNAVLSDLRFAYDGWNLVAEFSRLETENLTLKTSFTWGPDLSNTLQGAGGVGGLLAVRVGEADYYPCFDGNGNIIAWSDATGAVRRRIDYDPFGNLTTVENTATAMPGIPLGFSTKYIDVETGLVYCDSSFYDPVSGRWQSRTPIGEAGGLNLYRFGGTGGTTTVMQAGAARTVPSFVFPEPARMEPGRIIRGPFPPNARPPGGRTSIPYPLPAEVFFDPGYEKMVEDAEREKAKRKWEDWARAQGLDPNKQYIAPPGPQSLQFPMPRPAVEKTGQTGRWKNCLPCDPPRGFGVHEIALPNSRQHGAHALPGRNGGHVKYWLVEQVPFTPGNPKSCVCFWGKAITIENTQTPPPNTYLVGTTPGDPMWNIPPAGGGVTP